MELHPRSTRSCADGAILESSSRLLISSTHKNFQLLTILSVTAEDLGVYTCSLHNILGAVATTAVLRKAGQWARPGPSGQGEGHPTPWPPPRSSHQAYGG